MDRLKAIFLGGAPANDRLLIKAKDYRLPIVLSYGMTETAGMICAQSKDSFLSGIFSSGKPLFGAEIKLNTEEGFDALHIFQKVFFTAIGEIRHLNELRDFTQMIMGIFLKKDIW